MTQAHFQGKYEVELKYRLKDKAAFLQQLHNLPHEIMLQDNSESDRYYDTPDRRLESEHKHLCLREMQPSNIKLWIVKGPGPDQCQASRIENIDSAADMLTTLGYEVVLRMSKVRSIYFVDQFHITVDHLEGLGDFAELAIMTDDETLLVHFEQELLSLAKRLRLNDCDRETASYRTLMSQRKLTNA